MDCKLRSGWSAMGTRQEMAPSGPDFLRDSGPLPLQLLTGFKLKHGRSTRPVPHSRWPIIRPERVRVGWGFEDSVSNDGLQIVHQRGDSRQSKQIHVRRECLEISISGDDGNIRVNAALHNQSVAKPSFPFPSESLCTKPSGSMPESVLQRQQWEFQESFCHRGREFRVTQQFCQHGWRHYDLTGLKRTGQGENIVSLLSLKK